jgi:hypothetical protein
MYDEKKKKKKRIKAAKLINKNIFYILFLKILIKLK